MKWLSSAFKVPTPSGPPQTIRAFQPSDTVISRGAVSIAADYWMIDARERQTVRMFEVQDPGCEASLVTYRAKMRSESLKGRVYLEMWCRLPGRGEFFSKGFHQTLTGTTDWANFEIPFFLKKGQKPDLIKLNVVVEGTGKIWLKEIELLQTPLV